MKIILFFLFSTTLFAQYNIPSFTHQNITPIRSIDQLITPNSEVVMGLTGARIAIADYELIKKDFPFLSNKSNTDIDQWLLQNFAYISIPQSQQTRVNSKIPISHGKRIATRPKDYGRALVFDVKDENGNHFGLVDSKGPGSLKPKQADHSNGLMTLGESLREFSYEKMIASVLDHSTIALKTVGSYAVIYPNFDLIHADGSHSPAGIYLRQAHARNSHEWIPETKRFAIIKLFENYGIDVNQNIQGTRTDDIFDFGHYIVSKNVQGLNPDNAIPFEIWGHPEIAGTQDRWFYSKKDYPWQWSHETAEDFAYKSKNRHHVWMNHYNLLKPTIEKLGSAPPPEPLIRKLIKGPLKSSCQQYTHSTIKQNWKSYFSFFN